MSAAEDLDEFFRQMDERWGAPDEDMEEYFARVANEKANAANSKLSSTTPILDSSTIRFVFARSSDRCDLIHYPLDFVRDSDIVPPQPPGSATEHDLLISSLNTKPRPYAHSVWLDVAAA